jgi:hypothetical protein
MKLWNKGAALVAIILLAGLAVAQEPGGPWHFPDFSASQIYLTPNYPPATVSFSGSTLRVQRDRMVTLYALSLAKVYTITTYPDGSRSCVLMETKDAHMVVPSPLAFFYYPGLKLDSAGRETVESHPTQVKQGEVTGPDGLIKFKVWEAEDLKGVPIKIESRMPTGVDFNVVFRDVKLATPDKGLLSPPEKCVPFNKMWQDGGAAPPKTK